MAEVQIYTYVIPIDDSSSMIYYNYTHDWSDNNIGEERILNTNSRQQLASMVYQDWVQEPYTILLDMPITACLIPSSSLESPTRVETSFLPLTQFGPKITIFPTFQNATTRH